HSFIEECLIVLTRQLSGNLGAVGGAERVVQRLFFSRRNICLTGKQISKTIFRCVLRSKKISPLNTHDGFAAAVFYGDAKLVSHKFFSFRGSASWRSGYPRRI